MNYREFSAQIKAKHPQFADMDDRELASAVLQKHPQYRKLGISFDDEQEAPPEPQQPQRAAPIWSRQTGEIIPENVVPYYAEGARNLVQKPFETLFPGASTVEGQGVVPEIKRNVKGVLDVLGWLDRAIDYASGGSFEVGGRTISEAIDKIPGSGKIADMVRDNMKTGAGIVTSPSTFVGAGAIKNLLIKKTPGKIALSLPKKPGFSLNMRGAIGGVSDDFVGTPALRDPKTGKIYSGGWRGHKDAIIKGETSEIQERLKYQHLLDNKNISTENVGFIDKKGNYVSRRAAEEMFSKQRSLAQMYHGAGIVAGTGGAAAVADRTRHTIGNLINEKRR